MALDSGPGIDAEHRDMIFQHFYRVDKARWREDGGAGLGLSIVKWAAGAHQGQGQRCSFPDRLPLVKTSKMTPSLV